jgi:hypothetical protein
VLFFGNAVSAAVSAAMPCLAVALAALLTRAGLTMYASWRKVSPGLSYVNYWLMLASVLVPLSVGAAGIHLVTGLPLWRTSEGWVLGIGLCCGVAAVSLSFLYFLSQRQTSRKLIIGGRTANILLAGSTALLLPWVLYCTGSHVLGLGYSYLAVIAAALVLWQAVSLAARKEWRMWWYISFMALAGPVLVAVANFPYLFFPNWTLHEAAGFLAYGPLLLVALSVVGLVVFAGLICLARSLAALKK